eukprot:6675254-Prymnesium_polylepis.1
MMCAYSPKEFEDLHNDMLDVLEMVRDIGGVFTTTENAMRKKRRLKYVARAALQLPDVLPELSAPAQGLHRLGHRQDGPRRR